MGEGLKGVFFILFTYVYVCIYISVQKGVHLVLYRDKPMYKDYYNQDQYFCFVFFLWNIISHENYNWSFIKFDFVNFKLCFVSIDLTLFSFASIEQKKGFPLWEAALFSIFHFCSVSSTSKETKKTIISSYICMYTHKIEGSKLMIVAFIP